MDTLGKRKNIGGWMDTSEEDDHGWVHGCTNRGWVGRQQADPWLVLPRAELYVQEGGGVWGRA